MSKESEKYNFTMIIGQGCPACIMAKKGLSKRIDSGQIKVMDVVSDEKARDLADKYNINAVPSIIAENKATQFMEVCELRGDLSGVICDTKEVDF